MKSIVVVLAFMGIVAAESEYFEAENLELPHIAGSVRLESYRNENSPSASLYFTQKTPSDPFEVVAEISHLEEGKYIGLIHEAYELGKYCNESGKALATTNGCRDAPKPVVLMSELNYNLDDFPQGYSDKLYSNLNFLDIIKHRVLVIHRVPSDVEKFFEQALKNEHHESAVMCGVVRNLYYEPAGSCEIDMRPEIVDEIANVHRNFALRSRF